MSRTCYAAMSPAMFILATDFDTPSDDELSDSGMTEEEVDAYWKALRESEGFDVPSPPSHLVGLINPLNLEAKGAREAMEGYARLGIAHYNKEMEGRTLELVNVEKVMKQPTGPYTFYITFTATETGNDQIRTYQTKVLASCPITRSVVAFTRVKPEIKSQAAGPSQCVFATFLERLYGDYAGGSIVVALVEMLVSLH